MGQLWVLELLEEVEIVKSEAGLVSAETVE